MRKGKQLARAVNREYAEFAVLLRNGNVFDRVGAVVVDILGRLTQPERGYFLAQKKAELENPYRCFELKQDFSFIH